MTFNRDIFSFQFSIHFYAKVFLCVQRNRKRHLFLLAGLPAPGEALGMALLSSEKGWLTWEFMGMASIQQDSRLSASMPSESLLEEQGPGKCLWLNVWQVSLWLKKWVKTKCLDISPWMMTNLISCNTSSFFIILYALAPKLFAMNVLGTGVKKREVKRIRNDYFDLPGYLIMKLYLFLGP